MRNKLKTIIFIFITFILPVLIILILETGENKYKELPCFGPKVVHEPGDTSYYSFYKQSIPLKFTSSFKKEKILVVQLLPSPCTNYCIQELGNLKWIQNKLRDVKNLEFLSVSGKELSLSNISTEKLPGSNNWRLIQKAPGALDTLRRLLFPEAKRSHRKDPKLSKSGTNILLDKAGRIRGYYHTNKYKELKKLKDEIIVLSTSKYEGS